MPVINKGTELSNGEQLTAEKLNNLLDLATFSPTATDNVSTFVNSSGQITVLDSGIAANKLATNAVTTTKILNANVTTAKIADANVTTAKIADANVTFAKLSDVIDDDTMATASATTLATSESIKAYVDATAGGFTPSTYAGEESVTLPNGLIMKFGRFATSGNGAKTITFGSPFPTAVISVQAIGNGAGAETISFIIVGTPSTTQLQVGVADSNGNTGVYWQAIGY
tara:strand:- start:6 stop:686 length:681 start_codon:yes stop_codon:yes gene_type:complete